MISVHSLVRFRALALSEPVVAAAAPRGRGRPAAAGSAPPLDLFLLTTGVREDCGAYQKTDGNLMAQPETSCNRSGGAEQELAPIITSTITTSWTSRFKPTLGYWLPACPASSRQGPCPGPMAIAIAKAHSAEGQRGRERQDRSWSEMAVC